MKTQTAMLLAAGLGSRLKPWTDHHPKALAIINGKSLLQRNIEYLQSYGINDIIVNVHHFAAQIIDELVKNNGWGSHFTISDESKEVLETGGGLLKAKPILMHHKYFVLMNADMLTNLNIGSFIQQHLQSDAIATLAVTQRESSRQLLFNKQNQLGGWRNNISGEEKIMRTNSPLCPFAFSGVHVIDSKIFNFITQTGKFSMIDLYLSLCGMHNIQGFDHSGDLLLDVGKPESVALAEQLFK